VSELYLFEFLAAHVKKNETVRDEGPDATLLMIIDWIRAVSGWLIATQSTPRSWPLGFSGKTVD